MNPEHFHTDIVIPGRPFALESQARLGGVGFVRTDQVQHDLLEQGEVLRGVVFADHAVVLAEADVEHPVQAVLDGPVRAHGLGQFLGTEAARADVVARLQFSDLVADHPLRDNAADRLAAGPQLGVDLRAAGGDPAELQHRSAVGAVHVLEAVASPLGIADEIAHLLVQRGLVTLDGQQVIAPLVDDPGGDLALAAHGMCRWRSCRRVGARNWPRAAAHW